MLPNRPNAAPTSTRLPDLVQESEAVLGQAIDHSKSSYDYNSLSLTLEDQRGRLRVWAANLGARQLANSPKSLEYRLRDAPLMRGGVVSGLQRLVSSIKRAIDIINGSAPNRYTSAVESGSSQEHATTELDEAIRSSDSAISHLFKLSMMMRKNRPKGKLPVPEGSTFSESSPDITYVMDKFPKTKSAPWLARRLGNGISRRREFIRYRQHHRQSLGKQSARHLVGAGDTATIVDTVVATTFNETDTSEPSSPTQSENIGSQMSAFTSATSFISRGEGGSMEYRIPNLTDMVLDGVQLRYGEQFECPYCRTIQEAKDRSEWKRHVFKELEPYMCTFEDCAIGNQAFSTRAAWFQHENIMHRRQWVCSWCTGPVVTFSSTETMKKHFENVHPGMVTEAQVDIVLEACERPISLYGPSSCPLCEEWTPPSTQYNAKGFSRHLARHMQQLSLEALPLSIDGLDVRSSGDGLDEEGSLSGQSRIGEVSDETDDPYTTAHISRNVQREELPSLRYNPDMSPRHASEWIPGRILKMWWREPYRPGSMRSLDEADISLNQQVYEGWRRFIVIRTGGGHSVCLPITTYGGRGCCKQGVDAAAHGIIYDTRHKPRTLRREPELGFRPVRARMYFPEQGFTKESRIKYATGHALRHDFSVSFIGEIDADDVEDVKAAYISCLNGMGRGDDSGPSHRKGGRGPYDITGLRAMKKV